MWRYRCVISLTTDLLLSLPLSPAAMVASCNFRATGAGRRRMDHSHLQKSTVLPAVCVSSDREHPVQNCDWRSWVCLLAGACAAIPWAQRRRAPPEIKAKLVRDDATVAKCLDRDHTAVVFPAACRSSTRRRSRQMLRHMLEPMPQMRRCGRSAPSRLCRPPNGRTSCTRACLLQQ